MKYLATAFIVAMTLLNVLCAPAEDPLVNEAARELLKLEPDLLQDPEQAGLMIAQIEAAVRLVRKVGTSKTGKSSADYRIMDSYSIDHPDGLTSMVFYTAGNDGFHAKFSIMTTPGFSRQAAASLAG